MKYRRGCLTKRSRVLVQSQKGDKGGEGRGACTCSISVVSLDLDFRTPNGFLCWTGIFGGIVGGLRLSVLFFMEGRGIGDGGRLRRKM